MFSRSPLSGIRVGRLLLALTSPVKRERVSRQGDWPSGVTGPALCWAGTGTEKAAGLPPAPESAELCRAAAPRGRVTRAASLGNPAPKRPSRRLQPAGVPRAHPDSGTREPRAPLKPRSACGSRAAPHALFQAPNKEGRAGGPRSTSRQPALPLPRPRTGSARRGAALRSDSGRKAPRGVPGVLSPAPRSGDAREAGEGAQLVRRRASRHHAPAAAAPRRGPRLAAAGECPASRAPSARGTRFGGKTASVADSEAETGVARDLGAGSTRSGRSLGLL